MVYFSEGELWRIVHNISDNIWLSQDSFATDDLGLLSLICAAYWVWMRYTNDWLWNVASYLVIKKATNFSVHVTQPLNYLIIYKIFIPFPKVWVLFGAPSWWCQNEMAGKASSDQTSLHIEAV